MKKIFPVAVLLIFTGCKPAQEKQAAQPNNSATRYVDSLKTSVDRSRATSEKANQAIADQENQLSHIE